MTEIPPNCPSEFPWFTGSSEYSCQNIIAPGNLLDPIGCDVQNPPCHFQPPVSGWDLSYLGVDRHGKRWLRPSLRIPGESRAADGKWHWPLGASPLRLPWYSGFFDISMCYRQSFSVVLPWSEFWDADICSCRQGPIGSPYNGCTWNHLQTCNGKPFGKYVTCHWFEGVDWPPDITCTGKFLGATPEPVRFRPQGGGGQMLNADYIRAPVGHSQGSGRGCQVGWNTLCWGKNLNYVEGSGNQQEYNATNWQDWNFLRIDQIAARFFDDDDNQNVLPSDRAVLDAKNTVMAWIESNRTDMPLVNGVPQHLDQVDRLLLLTEFRRSWNSHLPGPAIPASLLPLIDPSLRWANCHLAKSRDRVIVEYVPFEIIVDLDMMALREGNRPGSQMCTFFEPDVSLRFRQRTVPVIKIRIRVKMLLRAQFADAVDGLEIVNSPAFDQLPRRPRVIDPTTGDVADRIIYVDNQGRTFHRPPPIEFVWWAEMGPGRLPWGADLFDHDYPQGNVENRCRALASGLQNVTVFNMWSHPDAGDVEGQPIDPHEPLKSRLYTGHVTFSAQLTAA